MVIAELERTESAVEAARAAIIERFAAVVANAPNDVVLEAAKLSDEKAFATVVKERKDNKQKSLETRNQEAAARMRIRAFERLESRCELLEAKEVCEILGIKKQALSKKTQSGQVLAYTNVSNRRKFYPSFQFSGNKPIAEIATLIKELGIDPSDTLVMNRLIQHLVSNMDYSDPGQPTNEVPRFELLNDKDALKIIKRDFINSSEMGQ